MSTHVDLVADLSDARGSPSYGCESQPPTPNGGRLTSLVEESVHLQGSGPGCASLTQGHPKAIPLILKGSLSADAMAAWHPASCRSHGAKEKRRKTWLAENGLAGVWGWFCDVGFVRDRS